MITPEEGELGYLAKQKSSLPGQMMTCLIESDIGAKIAMAFRKDISYYNTNSDDGNIEHNRKGRLFAANSPGLRASWKNLNLFGKSDNF